MEMKNNSLFDKYLEANNILEDEIKPLELKYIKLLCPIVQKKHDDAEMYYSKFKACRIDISSLANELGVSRPTIYKDGIIDFLEYCKGLYPGLYSFEEIKRLSKEVKEKEKRLKEFRLKDYSVEELRIKCMSADKTIAENNTSIKNLEKKNNQLQNENIELKKRLGLEVGVMDAPIESRTHLEIDVVNGHIKKGTHIK